VKKDPTHIKDLKHDPENAREHTPRNIGMIVDALHEVGAARSIVIDEKNQILAGNGTIDAAGQAGITKLRIIEADGNEIIAVRRKGLSKEQKRRLALYDNRAGELATWTAEELKKFKDSGTNLSAFFSDDELSTIFARMRTGGKTDPDAVPAQRETDIKPGDMFALGEHRLLCGDSLDLAHVSRLMDGKKAMLCFSSPPYWVGKSYEKQSSIQEVLAFIEQAATAIAFAVTKDGGRIALNVSTARAQAIDEKAEPETLFSLAWWQDALREKSWLMRHCRLWVKSGQMAAPSVGAKSDVVDQHWETVATFLPTFYCPSGPKRGQQKIKLKWAQQGVWDDIHGEANNAEHEAAFPVELPLRYLKLYTVDGAGEIIFEPFCGTGTTIIAAEQTERPCYAIELEPVYVQQAIDRWELFTGRHALKL
jgi:DNA modification methylase